MSRPARGGWIEIMRIYINAEEMIESRPARGGWIEIVFLLLLSILSASRPARGGWIEIIPHWAKYFDSHSPAPHGAGGLKSAF